VGTGLWVVAMNRESVREQAYKRLATASENYFVGKRAPEQFEAFLDVWRDIGRLKLAGAFDEAFVLLPLGTTSKATLDYLYNTRSNDGSIHPARAVFYTLPTLTLNEGNHRAGLHQERQLRSILDDFPVIDDTTIDLILLSVKNAPFNGASLDQVGAFLLNHAGERITAEYR
jgi:hypothetical protein